MFSRLFRKNPHTRKRAVALIVEFLKRHKERVFAEAFARHVLANVEAGGADAAVEGFGPHAQAQIGHYPDYAVHLGRYAVILCSYFLPEPIDDHEIYVDTGMAVYQALDLHPETAGEMVMRTIESTPENEAPNLLTDEEIAALTEAERRIVRLQNIARVDALSVMQAFGKGLRKFDLSDYDLDPLAGLLELSVIPDPDHERLAAEIKRRQG